MKDRFALAVIAAVAAATFVGCNRESDTAKTAGTAAAPSTRPTIAEAELPPYKQTPAQLDAFLKAHANDGGTIGERAVAIARKNVGQPYDLYLLGEAPFESIDAQPVFCLEKSDCVVAVEHEYAMALTDNFPDFMKMLQRIRYANGEVGVRTRNHYTEVDWNVNNRWLVRDVTQDVAGDRVGRYKLKVDRQRFFKNRYKIDVPVAVQPWDETYVPYEILPDVKSKLRTGDVFNVVTGDGKGTGWIHHLGLVAVMPDGAVHLIHSTQPAVREETIEAYVERAVARGKETLATKPNATTFRGFKFLRPNEDAIARLRAIDGADAPRVTLPKESPTTFDAFVAGTLAGNATTQPVARATAE